MPYIENIVIGTPLVSAKELLSANDNDWINVEFEKTLFTNERYLPNILIQLAFILLLVKLGVINLN